MSVSAKFGRALALGWLVMLYPALTFMFHSHPSAAQLLAILAALIVMAVIYGFYWLRLIGSSDWRLITAVVVVLFALGILLNLVTAWNVNPFLLPLVIAGYAYPARVAVAAVTALVVVSLVLTAPALNALHLTASDLVAIYIIAGVQLLIFGYGAIGASWLVRTIRQLHQAREQLAAMAVEQERARFARDLHDLLGHSLSVITLKGELAQQLIESAPQRARAELQDIVQVARGALREVRETVSGYRQPTLASEVAGAQTALAAAGIECHAELAAGALTADTEAVLAWTVREGATNVLRHSKARRCSLRLTRDDEGVQLDVVDDGPTVHAPEAGNGLRGLGERVSEQGGRLEAGPLPHQGFRLRVTLPAGNTVRRAPATSALDGVAE